ncbi:hypothetical protein HK414_08115 [Ramlibacter terrae]|uniref:Uncharacterized protein n=1 Tax=Ramlibacter terrae TaxID=2732511 RepID=A0ABX6P2W4_9BURK|nr:hypothetical protein HK414_08115 [Ramlibacter terrae]
MALIYLGVCEADDEQNEGELRPKGSGSAVSMKRDGRVRKRIGQFDRIPSESNAVRAHHIDRGLYGGCWVSFTQVEKVARRFATTSGMTDGFVYVVDEDLLTANGVEKK